MEKTDDILRQMRSMKSSTLHGKMWVNTIHSFANRLEKAREFELAVERAKAAGEGYATGKQSVTDCNLLEMRKADSIRRAMVLLAGIEMENPEDPPRLWTALEDAWDALCDALGTVGDVNADVAEAKAIGRHFVVKPSGNAAKLCEALMEIIDTVDKWRSDGVMEHWQYSQIYDIADAALSAPSCKNSSQVEYKPMTLDEAIAHAEEAVNDSPCGREHKQLVDWLKELRDLKTKATESTMS